MRTTGYSVGQAKYWITRINRLARKSDSSNVSDRETRKWAQVSVIEPDGNDSGISISVGAVRIDVRNGLDKSALADVMGYKDLWMLKAALKALEEGTALWPVSRASPELK